jgi:hypothetical protein
VYATHHPTIVAGATLVRAAHIRELTSAVLMLEGF